MYYWGINELTNTLLVPAREEYQVVRVESEVWGGPRDRMEELGGLRHFVVGFDSRFFCALLMNVLADV
jgi:hypothetical protein